MADYHTVYKGPEGETTQWQDIQRRLGNLPAKALVWKPDAYAPEAEAPSGAAKIREKDADELSDLEDDFSDDRALEEYRWGRVQPCTWPVLAGAWTAELAAGRDVLPRASLLCTHAWT
jgi:hypothetical protein